MWIGLKGTVKTRAEIRGSFILYRTIPRCEYCITGSILLRDVKVRGDMDLHKVLPWKNVQFSTGKMSFRFEFNTCKGEGWGKPVLRERKEYGHKDLTEITSFGYGLEPFRYWYQSGLIGLKFYRDLYWDDMDTEIEYELFRRPE